MSAFLLALHAGVRNRAEESVPSSSCWLIQSGNTHFFVFVFQNAGFIFVSNICYVDQKRMQHFDCSTSIIYSPIKEDQSSNICVLFKGFIRCLKEINAFLRRKD